MYMEKTTNVEIEGSAELFGFYIEKSVKNDLREIAYHQTQLTGNRVSIADLVRYAINKLINEVRNHDATKQENGN